MQTLTKKFNLERFWDQLSQAKSALLLLDFDGTLSPFVKDPHQARFYPGVAEVLSSIIATGKTRLVIISGREINSLISCLQLDPLPEVWGCHGWQRQLPGGHILQRRLPDEAAACLKKAADWAKESGYQAQLESKPVSLALHWRGLNPTEISRMQDRIGSRWRQLIASEQMKLKNFDGGQELCCPEVNKGTAVEQLLQEIDEQTLVAYLGDDQTDEDAFSALDDRGLKLLVRPQLRETAADCWLQPPEELLNFLQHWYLLRGGTSEGE